MNAIASKFNQSKYTLEALCRVRQSMGLDNPSGNREKPGFETDWQKNLFHLFPSTRLHI
jgi:hypothetical protein